MFVLIVKQRGATQEHPLCDGHTLVGRGQTCDVVINDDSTSGARAALVHAGQVERHDLRWSRGRP